MPVPLFLPEIMSQTMRAGNKSFLANFLTERVNPALRKCCFVHRWLISLVAAIGINQKKQSIIFGGFSTRAAWTLCYREGLDYYRIVVLFDGYRRQSIKARTRSRHSKNLMQIVGRGITGREVPLHAKYFLHYR